MELIGHRGAAGYEPENTIRAVLKGIECGATGIEVDVRRSKDGVLVLMHDETVDRTTNGSGRVGDLTFEELRKLDAGKGEKIPTLREFLEVIKGRVKGFIELKEVGYEDQVLEEVKKYGLLEEVYIISFHVDAVKRVKQLNPSVKTGLIFSRKPWEYLRMALEIKADLVVPYYGLVKMDYLKEAHTKGLKVSVWTVNKERDMAKLINMGVDAITSDYPCLLVDVWKRVTGRKGFF